MKLCLALRRLNKEALHAGNWKMNKTIPETVVLTQQLCNQYNRKWDNVDIVLCPPAIDIKAAYTVLDFDKTKISLGAQNAHWEESGAFTGEISIPMIKDAGCEYCIVGHSERREMFNETDTTVNLKVKALVSAGIAPIVCVGESLAMRDSGDYVEFITAQVRAGLAGLDAIDMKNVVVAYEPIWATLNSEFGVDVANATRILYGGSMNAGNVEALLAQSDIDGGLVGGASLKADSFRQLIEAASEAQ